MCRPNIYIWVKQAGEQQRWKGSHPGRCAQDPPWDSGSFAKVVTRDATPAAGAAEACAPNMRQAWQELFAASESQDGRQQLRDSMLLCDDAPLKGRPDADPLANWLSSAFDYLVCPGSWDV